MVLANKKSPIIWLTGMSGCGKSTLASGLVSYFVEQQLDVHVLDGDEIRGNDKIKLGFGYDDVLTNNMRIANHCQSIRKKYDVIVIPVISSYDGVRMMVRSVLEPNFHLIYLQSDIDSLRNRDPKGLYQAADDGVINDLIGYSDVNPYDIPHNAELTINTSNQVTVEESKQELINYIRRTVMADKYLF